MAVKGSTASTSIFKFIERKSYKLHYRVFLSRFSRLYDLQRNAADRACGRKYSMSGWAKKNIQDIVRMTIEKANRFFQEICLSKYERGNCQAYLGRNSQAGFASLTESGLGISHLTGWQWRSPAENHSALILQHRSVLHWWDRSMSLMNQRSDYTRVDNRRLVHLLKSLRDMATPSWLWNTMLKWCAKPILW